MREIKFRAWDETNKKMIRFDHNDMYDYFLELNYWENAELVTIEEKGGYTPYMDKQCVKNATIMQYTGLKDSARCEEFLERIEIYESDILYDIVANAYYIVTWDDSYAMFFLKNINQEKPDYDFCEYDVAVCNNLYVVGNIYENPELLQP